MDQVSPASMIDAGRKRAVIEATCWGTRGSIASPGPDTVRFGGNTPCLEVRLRHGRCFIFDAGTGIRPLGVSMMGETGTPDAVIFLTHFHWDHIQGFPFFLPLYEPEMHRRAHARMELETDLQWAMEREEFRVFYQPIVSLEDGTIAGAEALLRWEHPRRGLLGPSEFLSVAEETGMIIPLGSWVLEHSCRQMREWHEGILRESPLSLSVNLSAKQVLWRDLARHVGSVLEDTGLDGRSLRLEMTEMAMVDAADPILSVLADLKELKVSLDMDDFGIGHSSLRHLHLFPIDSLKIDRSFVADLHVRSESEEIVRTILALAQNIGVSVVAEGVETPDELAVLIKMNCDLAQGHLFSKPLRHDQMTELIGNHRYAV